MEPKKDTTQAAAKPKRAYTENNYERKNRTVSRNERKRLAEYQVPAIERHFGSLEGRVFLDIGAGDIVLGEHQEKIGRPAKFYVQDINRQALASGIKRLSNQGIDTSNIVRLVSDSFNFDKVEDSTVDCAFSNSLFSHLTLNSIIFCLRRLRPKMKTGSSYLSSMVVVPGQVEPEFYHWNSDRKSKRHNFRTRAIGGNTYHYTESSIELFLQHETGFSVKAIHEYGHRFQKLVEFRAQ